MYSFLYTILIDSELSWYFTTQLDLLMLQSRNENEDPQTGIK